MNISVPRSVKAWIDRQVREGGYGTASEFIRDVLRQAKASRDELERSLLEAMRQPSSPMSRADWEEIRREGERRAEFIRSRMRRATARRKSA